MYSNKSVGVVFEEETIGVNMDAHVLAVDVAVMTPAQANRVI